MTKEEFIENIKENKYIEDLELVIKHRLPVVQYYLRNYTNVIISDGIRTLRSNMIDIHYNEESDFNLVNYAYNEIVKKYKNGEIQ